MNDRNYWRRRAEQLEREWQGRCRSEVEKELAAHYRSALTEIADDIAALFGRFSRDNSLGYLEARRLIRGAEFKAWRMSLEEYVAAAAADSAILKELNTLAMRSRISRLEKLYSETLVELQKLGERSEAAIGDFLKTAGRERYLQGLYDLGSVGKLAIPVSKLNPANLEKTLAARWEGGNYSTRIWKNTTKLAKTLKATISQGLHRGLSIDKMSKAIDRDMRAGYKNAERLVRTEMNFVQTRMAADSMSAAGLDEYEFVAVLDHRTTQRCQALDGTTHLIEEMQQGANAPPMHPRCRSTITATFSESLKGGTRTARDKSGRNIRIPADMSYSDWKAVYIDKATSLKAWQDENTLHKGAVGGIILQNTSKKPKLSSAQQIIKDAEDAAFEAKTDSDFGFDKMKCTPDWPKELILANGDGKGVGRMTNCQRCVVAIEARMRGYDVISRRCWGDSDPLREKAEMLSVFEHTNEHIKKCSGNTAAEVVASIERIMRSFGDEARAIIWFDWSKASGLKDGHAIVAQCSKGGAVIISDPQTKKRSAAEILKMANLETVGIMRVDDLKFTDKVKRCCVNRGGQDGL